MANASVANFTATGADRSIQYNWTVDAHACGRVPPDWDLPYVCIGSGRWQGLLESPSLTYAAYEPCCNKVNTSANNVFAMQNSCSSVWCYTDDVARTHEWRKCYQKAVSEQIERLRRQNSTRLSPDMTTANVVSNCEYLDREMLKQGLVNKPKNSAQGARGVGVGLWSIMMGCLMIASLL